MNIFNDDFVIEPVIEVPLVYEITPFMKGGASFIHMDMKDTGEGIHQKKILLEHYGKIFSKSFFKPGVFSS